MRLTNRPMGGVQVKYNFSLGLLLGICLMGCAGVSFPYKWYYPEFDSYDGKLLAHLPADDLDGTVCAKDAQGNHGCAVMLKSDFKAMVIDYQDTKIKLIECERGSK